MVKTDLSQQIETACFFYFLESIIAQLKIDTCLLLAKFEVCFPDFFIFIRVITTFITS